MSHKHGAQQFGSQTASVLIEREQSQVPVVRSLEAIEAVSGGVLTAKETRAAAIPVLDENLRVDKTIIETDRVFIRTSVLERTEYAELELRSGEAIIERVPVHRVVESPPAIRQEGDITIVPVVEEIMVVEKRLLLKEEIHIRRQEFVEHIRQPVRLRSEEVSVERQPPRHPNNITSEEE